MKVEVHDALIGEVLHPMKFVTFDIQQNIITKSAPKHTSITYFIIFLFNVIL